MTDVKKLILSRRARFIAAAVAGAGLVQGCEAQACLDVAYEPDAAEDGKAQACLKVAMDAAGEDVGPQGCLQPPWDAAEDAEPHADAADEDAGPQMCLEAPWDAAEDAEPQMCLQPPPDACLKLPYDPDAD
jgi:hypothetical protein